MKIFTSMKTLALAAGMLLFPAVAFAGDGTKSSPYTVAELNAQKDALAASGNVVWVKADLKGLGEDGMSNDNADTTDADNKTVKHMAALFGDETGTFVAYSWHILGQLSLSDLSNTQGLLISLTYGTAGHSYGNSTYPQYATSEEPSEAHFSLEEVHGALSLTIQNGYRGYHIPAFYKVPEGMIASTVSSSYTSSKGASISYKEYGAGEMIPKNAAMVLVAANGTYDIVLVTGLYPQTITNSNSLNGGTQAGENVIPMKNNALRYHYRFVADGSKVGFERNSTESTIVILESKDEVYLTINGNDNHFYGNWTWETDDRNWISWKGTTSGINAVSATANNAANTIYNLQGQRQIRVQRGVNIFDGKKYIVK